MDENFNDNFGDITEKCVSSRTVYEGRVITMKVDDIVLPDGTPSKREYVEHRGGAAILAVDEEDRVYLVRQFRYPYREAVLEIPAGKLEAGEDPKFAAARELSEETGLVAEDLKQLGVIYPSPGYTNEKLYIYLATRFSRGAAHPDEDERLRVERVPFGQALEMTLSGELKDSKTCYAILHYAQAGAGSSTLHPRMND